MLKHQFLNIDREGAVVKLILGLPSSRITVLVFPLTSNVDVHALQRAARACLNT